MIWVVLYLFYASATFGQEKVCLTKGCMRGCLTTGNPLNDVLFSFGNQDPSLDVQGGSGRLSLGQGSAGLVIPVTEDLCKFPARMSDNKVESFSKFGINFPEVGRGFIRNFKGFFGKRDINGELFTHIQTCDPDRCLFMFHQADLTRLGLVITSTGEDSLGGNLDMFIQSFEPAKHTLSVTCILRGFQEDLGTLTKFSVACTHFIFVLEDDSSPCKIGDSYPKDWTNENPNLNISVLYPIQGYTADDGELCDGIFHTGDVPDLEDPTYDETLCQSIGVEEEECVSPSPVKILMNFKSLLESTQVTSFYLWNRPIAAVENQAKEFAKLFKGWRIVGPEMLLSHLKSDCQVIETVGYEDCQWVLDLNITNERDCLGDVLSTGYFGKTSCFLECPSPFSYTTCDLMSCRRMIKLEQEGFYHAWRGTGYFMFEGKGQYAWANVEKTRRCFGANGFFTCEGPEEPREFCTEDSCWIPRFKYDLLHDGLIYCFHGVCARGGDLFVDVPTRVPRDVGSSATVLTFLQQKASAVILTAQSDSIMTKCCLQSPDQRSCTLCDDKLCLLEVDFRFAKHKDVVFSDCDGVIEKHVWILDIRVGELLGAPKVDDMINWFRIISPYFQFIIVVSILVLIQLFYWFLKKFKIFCMIKEFLKMSCSVLFKTPRFIRQYIANFMWYWRTYNCCEHCGSDTNFTEHTSDSCPYKGETTCPEIFCNVKCEEPIAFSQGFMRHWYLCHLDTYNLKSVMWTNPMNWWKWYSIKRGTKAIKTEQEKAMKKKTKLKIRTPLLGLALLTFAAPGNCSVNLAATGDCSSGVCKFMTNGMVDQIYSGQEACFSTGVGSSGTDFCVTLRDVYMTGVCPIAYCRYEPHIQFYGRIACASNGAGEEYRDELKNFLTCPQFADRTEKSSGGYDWGCGIPNVNSIFVKGFVSDSGMKGPCIVDTTGSWEVKTVLCIHFGSDFQCDTTGLGFVSSKGINITYKVDFPGRPQLPAKLLIGTDGILRTVKAEDSECFLFKKRKISGEPCSQGLHYPTGSCGYSIRHWWSLVPYCNVPSKDLCIDNLEFPVFRDTKCHLDKVVENRDLNSYTISGTGCTDGVGSIRFSVSGQYNISTQRGQVVSLKISNCVGFSGSTNSAGCDVYPICTGGLLFCLLTSPVQKDIKCGQTTTVYFTGTTGSKARFTCDGLESIENLTLSIILPKVESFNVLSPVVYGKADDEKSSMAWWVILLITIGSVFGFILVLIVSCMLWSVYKDLRLMKHNKNF